MFSRFSRIQKLLLVMTLALVALASVASGISAVRLAIAAERYPTPEAIFVLGGVSQRERFAARLARQHPDLDVWISSGTDREKSQPWFDRKNIPPARVHRDYRAIDTVTNFTSLVGTFVEQPIHHLYLVTSDFHMPRARAIAFFVLGSRGIAFTPVVVPSPPEQERSESWLRVVRDSARSLVWLATGRTGARFNPRSAFMRQFQKREERETPAIGSPAPQPLLASDI